MLSAKGEAKAPGTDIWISVSNDGDRRWYFSVCRRSFLLAKKSFTAIINMTYSCRVGFDMIHTERERNEDRQADRDTVRAAAGRENYGTGAGGTV